MRKYTALWLGFLLMLGSCAQDEVSLKDMGALPTADFTVTYKDANHLILKNASKDAFLYTWDFGAQGKQTVYGNKEVEVYLPFKKSYDIKLIATGKAGVAEIVKRVEVKSTDAKICGQPVLQLLTGGCDALSGKTWVWSKEAGAMWVGPDNGKDERWWQSDPGGFTADVYDDEYTFTIEGTYINDNKGKSRVNWYSANQNLAGSAIAPGFGGGMAKWADAEIAMNTKQPATFRITTEGERTFLRFDPGCFIGYYNAATAYEILSLTADKLYLRALYSEGADGGGYRYYTFIPKK